MHKKSLIKTLPMGLIFIGNMAFAETDSNYLDQTYNSIELSYNKILIDKEEETGTYNTFDLVDDNRGYNIGINQKINNLSFKINYSHYEFDGTNPSGYIGPQINENKKLHSTQKVDFNLGYIYKINNNLHIIPSIGLGNHKGESSQITYVDSERSQDIWNAGLTLKHSPFDKFYYGISYKKQDTISKEYVSSSINQEYYGDSETYSVEANFSPLNKISIFAKYNFVYSRDQYNEVLTGGYLNNADHYQIGVKLHY